MELLILAFGPILLLFSIHYALIRRILAEQNLKCNWVSLKLFSTYSLSGGIVGGLTWLAVFIFFPLLLAIGYYSQGNLFLATTIEVLLFLGYVFLFASFFFSIMRILFKEVWSSKLFSHTLYYWLIVTSLFWCGEILFSLTKLNFQFDILEEYILTIQLLSIYLSIVIALKHWRVISWWKASKQSLYLTILFVILIMSAILFRAVLLNFGQASVYEGKWKTYIDPSSNFSISYPDNLEFKTEEGNENTIVFSKMDDEAGFPVIEIKVKKSEKLPQENDTAPLFMSCNTGSAFQPRGVEDLLTNQNEDVRSERFLDIERNYGGKKGATASRGYFFTVRKGSMCYTVNILSPDLNMHTSDISKMLDSFDIK